MNLDIAESLTRWSVRLAIACYLARVLGEVGGVSIKKRMAVWQKSRRYWSAGCVFYLIHVACAFGFFHQWSHQNAYQHTAIETAAVTGVHWGGGIYLNYLFTLFWVSEVLLWWFYGIDFPYRSRCYFWTTHFVFATMVVNATVVFGPPYWLGIAGLVLILIGLRYWQRGRIVSGR